MVIAGDLYDGQWKDYNTGHFFCRQMGRLHQAGIPVYLLFGNHDAESEMTKKLLLPPNVHTFTTRRPSTFRIDDLNVVLHGQSFRDAATTENLAVSYPPPVPGAFNIGVLHTALEGNAAHATYAPCSVAELVARGYGYWALGHVHEHAVVREDPRVVFPGNLQGRHVRECGPRGACLVAVDGDRVQRVERLLVDVLRWQVVEVDASEARTMEAVVRAVGRAFEGLHDEAARPPALGAGARHRPYPSPWGVVRARAPPARGGAGPGGGHRPGPTVGRRRCGSKPPRPRTGMPCAPAPTPSPTSRRCWRLPPRARPDCGPGRGVAPPGGPGACKGLLQALPELAAVRSGELSDLVREVTPGLVAHLAGNG